VNLTDEDVREILRLLDETPYDELKLETDRYKLTLRKTGQKSQASWMRKGTSTPVDIRPAPEAPSGMPAGLPLTATAANGEICEIRPPMPGTFYRAPGPGAKPFTEVGSAVTEDSILGLVETMKLMNSVMAGCRGVVIEICAGNGAAVEVEDTLMRIRVAAHA
jgi:acetyl-CoA carboxylase biotin carboxyl carrier protein